MERFDESNIDLVLSVVECVAKHNLTVQQLKMIFRLLHTQGDHRAKHADSILQMLNELYLAADYTRPNHSYLLVPEGAGIQLTPETRDSKSSGYALSLWFNVHQFAADWIMQGGGYVAVSPA